MEVHVLEREFLYNGVKLPDTTPTMTPEQVRDTYTHLYPEIATAAIEGPETSRRQTGLQICSRYRSQRLKPPHTKHAPRTEMLAVECRPFCCLTHAPSGSSRVEYWIIGPGTDHGNVARGRIQRYLEENSAFVSQSTLHDWYND